MIKKNHQHVRLFKSSFLEFFTYTHPVIPAVIFVPILLMLAISSHEKPHTLAIHFMLGILLWSFLEYLIHRFLFHLPFDGKQVTKLKHLLHGIHHVDPNDPLRLVAPPVMSLTILFLLFGLLSLFFTSAVILALGSGIVAGYLFYDYCHYALHHFNFKNKIFKYLKRKHFSHHFKDKHMNFGVSSPLWDVVFRTYK